jgi:hypothetical protein
MLEGWLGDSSRLERVVETRSGLRYSSWILLGPFSQELGNLDNEPRQNTIQGY